MHYATDYKLPSNLKLKTNENGTPDIAVFDFTSLKKSANASRIMERKGKRLLLALVGDSLLEVSNYHLFAPIIKFVQYISLLFCSCATSMLRGMGKYVSLMLNLH